MKFKKDRVRVLIVALTLSLASMGVYTYQENSYNKEIDRLTLEKRLEVGVMRTKIEALEEEIEVLVEENSQLQATTDELKGLKEEQDRLVEELKGRVNKLEERAKQPSVNRGSTSRTSNDLTKPSGVTVERIEEVLKGTKLEGLGKYYMQAERDYGINAKFLVGLSIEESGWGKSNIANTKNNLFGFQAYTNNTSQARTFSSKGECILYVGKYIADNYLTEGGKHYNGVTVESVHEKYADNPKWASNIKAHMNRF